MIAQIERAIAALVRTTSDAGTLGYAFATISSYDEAVTALANGVLEYPALWVAYEGEDAPVRVDHGTYNRRANFSVAVAAEQWLNIAFARDKAATGLPGAYQLADDIWGLLVDRDFGLPIRPIEPGAIRPEVDDAGLTVCHIDFAAEFTASAPDRNGDLADYLHHHIDWDVEPHGNVDPPLPTEVADLRDDITLPGPTP